jgi:hypothetical protein
MVMKIYAILIGSLIFPMVATAVLINICENWRLMQISERETEMIIANILRMNKSFFCDFPKWIGSLYLVE